MRALRASPAGFRACRWSCPALMDGLGLRQACLGHRVSFRIRWAKDSPGPNGGVRDCTSPHQKTHGTEAGDEVEVVYPWHPWVGRTVCVHEVVERGAITSARCSLAGAAPVRIRELPLGCLMQRAAARCAWRRIRWRRSARSRRCTLCSWPRGSALRRSRQQDQHFARQLFLDPANAARPVQRRNLGALWRIDQRLSPAKSRAARPPSTGGLSRACQCSNSR